MSISSTMSATSKECDERTILVGMKMNEESPSVLTWSLMKVARPGDLVVLVHVVTHNNQNSGVAEDCSLLSLVKAFDSVFTVYEGFCSLKQVELKLKICRGSSVPKILIQESNLLAADMVVIGTSRTHNHTVWRLSSVAKYLSRKLPKECSLLAIKNGKLVFQRKSDPSTVEGSSDSSDGKISRRSCRVDWGTCFSDPIRRRVLVNNFPIDKNEAKPLPVIPSNVSEVEFKPGWPLLRRSIYLSSMSVGSLSPNDTFKMFPNMLAKSLHERYSKACRVFTYQELSAATSNFLRENVIGEGGNSVVYKGRLMNERKLAVKVLKPRKEVLKTFSQELEILTTLNHKNILTLQGFCFNDSKIILVYDFISRGSLEDSLHGYSKYPSTLNWTKRYKIALGVAEALEYLHSDDSRPIIHRDVKSSNILLTDDFEPKLSDFGLAERMSSPPSNHTCTDIAGTFGYLAPEYFMYGKVSNKIDVYAFGVVLLELLSGRKPVCNDYPNGLGSLVLWAMPILRDGNFLQLLDPKMSDDYDHREIERMALAAILCLRRDPKARPPIRHILQVLRGDEDMKSWGRAEAKTFDSEDVNSRIGDWKSLLEFAMMDMDDDTISINSVVHQNISIEKYLQGRCSCSSGSSVQFKKNNI